MAHSSLLRVSCALPHRGRLEQTIALISKTFYCCRLSPWEIHQKIFPIGLVHWQHKDVLLALFANFRGFLFSNSAEDGTFECTLALPPIPSRHLNDLFIIPVYRAWLLNSLPRITQWMKPNVVVCRGVLTPSVGAIVWAQCIECFSCPWAMKAGCLWCQWKVGIFRLMTDFWGLFSP